MVPEGLKQRWGKFKVEHAPAREPGMTVNQRTMLYEYCHSIHQLLVQDCMRRLMRRSKSGTLRSSGVEFEFLPVHLRVQGICLKEKTDEVQREIKHLLEDLCDQYLLT